MKLEAVELRNVGLFTDAVSVGPLDAGLNVLAATNESGKSTLLMATARALFDRHTVGGDVIESLRPVGTALAPEVTVTFETREGRFQIFKRFLQSPAAELREYRGDVWAPIADGDAADLKTLDLIGGVRAARGASKAEHWGMLRHLWARQGEASSWPELDDATGAAIRHGLAGVEVDPLIETLMRRLDDLAQEQFTMTGRVRRNGPLESEEARIAEREAELAEVRQGMERLERQQAELTAGAEERAVREKEKEEAERNAADLTEQLRNVELLRKDLARFDEALAGATKDLQDIDKDRNELAAAAEKLKAAEQGASDAEKKRLDLIGRENALGLALSDLRTRTKAARQSLDEVRKRETRSRELRDLQDSETAVTALAKRVEQAKTQAAALETTRANRAGLADVSRKDLAELRAAEQNLRELRVRAEAVGLRLRLAPEADGVVEVSRDGQVEDVDLRAKAVAEVTASRDASLSIPGWGRIDIVSGAEEAATLEAEISGQAAALEERLNALKVSSLEQAQMAAERAAELDAEIKSAAAKLADLLAGAGTLAELEAELDRRRAEDARQRSRLQPSETESGLTAGEFKAALTALRSEVEEGRRNVESLSEAADGKERELAAATQARGTADSEWQDARQEIVAMTERIKTRSARYGNGVDAALNEAQVAFVNAKAEHGVATKRLPADWDKLEARQERALKAAEQAAVEFDALRRRLHGLEAVLKEAGTRGLYSRETALLEELEAARRRASVLRRNATAARLLSGLLGYRKKQAVRTVLAPLEEQLSAAFAELTGRPERRVFLDENLQVTGVGRKREAAIGFDQLSQGAKEQLLLALRAAVALQLAADEPQILILDDVLVNTDAVRQQNVLDFIQQVARSVQVLIVTCHADRYRGVGTAMSIRAAEAGDSPNVQ